MRRPRDRYHNNIGTPLDGMNGNRYVERMNNTTKPGAVLPPLNFFVGCNDYDRLICDRSHVEALFNDDETINDGAPLFDAYAFRVWNDQEHNEDDVSLSFMIWESYNTADVDATDPDDY
jgi:hypothetical protein